MASGSMRDFFEIYIDVRRRPFVSYIAWNMLVWLVMAAHYWLTFKIPSSSSSLSHHWELVGAICVTLGLFSVALKRAQAHVCHGAKAFRLVVTLLTFCWATSFAGLYCAHQLYDYWYYNDMTTYHNIDVTEVPSHIGMAGIYYFTPSAAIVPHFGGATSYWNGLTYRYVCVLPLLPTLLTDRTRPYLPGDGSSFDVRFWVAAEDDCCTQPLFDHCMQQYGWSSPYQYGVSFAHNITRQEEALAATVATWPSDPNAPRTLIATAPVFLQWTTAKSFARSQSNRKSTTITLTAITLLLWPLWSIVIVLPVLILPWCRRRCICGLTTDDDEHYHHDDHEHHDHDDEQYRRPHHRSSPSSSSPSCRHAWTYIIAPSSPPSHHHHHHSYRLVASPSPSPSPSSSSIHLHPLEHHGDEL